MPRIRCVKPEIWLSPQVMNLSHGARLLFLGLITQADDHGRGNADIRKLKAAIFPGDDVLTATVREWLAECAAQRLAILYSADDFGELYALPTWDAHQYVPKRSPTSRYPDPVKATGTLPEHSGNSTVGSTRARMDRKDLMDQKDLTRARATTPVDNSSAASDDLKIDSESRKQKLVAALADPAITRRLIS
jgi:hypothetical protein